MVKGAVDIAYGVCTELASKGIDMDNTQKVQLVSNLLTVISSEQSATPTIPLQL